MGFSSDDTIVSVAVPYLTVPPHLERNSVYIRAITVDFDVAEAIGCSLALSGVCGGSMKTRMAGLMVGCVVHFERDSLRRCDKILNTGSPSAPKISKADLMNHYRSPRIARDRAYDRKILEQLSNVYKELVEWTQKSNLLPQICPAFSNISDEDRKFAQFYNLI